MPWYDPNTAPDPDEWLAQDEAERVEAAAAYHRIHGLEAQNAAMHARIHAAVETQLAEGEAATWDALDRLMDGGLDRHEALHAIGYVYAQHLLGATKSGTPGRVGPGYARDLARIDPKRWKTR